MNSLISDIFVTSGNPTKTYIFRDEGHNEKKLENFINHKGTICVIFGPSKAGKTSLLRNVLKKQNITSIVVTCNHNMTANEVWLTALEDISAADIDSITKTQAKNTKSTNEIGARATHFAAEVNFKKSAQIELTNASAITERKIRSQSNLKKLIGEMHKINAIFVLEDAHYLDKDVQKELFQQWKYFVDMRISTVVISTGHRVLDMVSSNNDLLGRIGRIEISRWQPSDLKEIAIRGFKAIGFDHGEGVALKIPKECAGLPIIMQEICLKLFTNRRITEYPVGYYHNRAFNGRELYDALHQTALEKYGDLEKYYTRFSDGHMQKNRKYNTYEILMSCFYKPEIAFSLKKSSILERITLMGLHESEVPTISSINSTLSKIDNLQMKMKYKIMEWDNNEKILYLIEPAFAFFAKWRRLEIVEELEKQDKDVLYHYLIERFGHQRDSKS